VYQIDLMAVENEDGDSTRSGDAIAMQFIVPGEGRNAVVVIDGGFTVIGDKLVDHIAAYYTTSHVDLVISTHPDTDHINGLIKILERCTVGELMLHLPWNYNAGADELGNYEKIYELYQLAISKGITVSEPFTGDVRFNGAITILGPSSVYYSQLIAEAVADVRSGKSEEWQRGSLLGSALLTKGVKLLERMIASFPFETLSNSDETSPRNKTSVITMLKVDGKRFLFTGDAGIPSLEFAADYYEATGGSFSSDPLDLFQAPHHGSHRNLGPDILNRILGAPGAPFGVSQATISSAKSAPKHPSPKVTNALGRRGATVTATEGNGILFSNLTRAGWSAITPIGPLDEGDDD
jgi:beta-lactamase superfamily II metal-dependent hydrolase